MLNRGELWSGLAPDLSELRELVSRLDVQNEQEKEDASWLFDLIP